MGISSAAIFQDCTIAAPFVPRRAHVHAALDFLALQLFNQIMRKWIPIIILAAAQFVMVLDSTVMNVSISTVAQDLGTSISGMQAAITFYALTMAALMLTGAKLGDIWGRHRAFMIGSVIYGTGSLITAVSPSLTALLFGWSIVEGLGAVLVIPAIASLVAINYSGKDRVIAFSLIGAIAGLAAAVGPIIGGFVTTYFSWRYVFAAETIVMIIVLLFASKIRDSASKTRPRIDLTSVFLSATGMAFLVFGLLQSKTWGWVSPLAKPVINGHELAPLGVSLVAYLILIGVIILWLFWDRQITLIRRGKDALLNVTLLSIPVLKSGLQVLLSQYFVIASLFFIVPVYLQTILGYDALQTGIKLLPLSIGLVLFSILGSRLSAMMSSRKIARYGQLAMSFGTLLLLGAVQPELKSIVFALGFFIVGSGFGLLASQIGNTNMSTVKEKDQAEVGGLQGTYQNLGTAFGTALVGSLFLTTLTTGFVASVQSTPNLSAEAKASIVAKSETGVAIVSEKQVNDYIINQGGSQATAETVGELYTDSQIEALRRALFFVFAASVLSYVLSKNLPNELDTKRNNQIRPRKNKTPS